MFINFLRPVAFELSCNGLASCTMLIIALLFITANHVKVQYQCCLETKTKYIGCGSSSSILVAGLDPVGLVGRFMNYLPIHQYPAHCTSSPLAYHPSHLCIWFVPKFSGLAGVLGLCNPELWPFKLSATVCWWTLCNMSEDPKSSVLPLWEPQILLRF